MNVGEIIAGAGVGAAKSYFDGNVQKAQAKRESDRLSQEQQRKEKLLQQKEAIQAAYSYKLQELKGKQSVELEGIKADNQIKLETIKNKGTKGGYSEKELNQLDLTLKKEYNKYVSDTKANFQDPVSYNEYITTNFKRQADILGITKEAAPGGDDSNESPITALINRVKGKGGPSKRVPEMIASHESAQSPEAQAAQDQAGATVVAPKGNKVALPSMDSSGGTVNASPVAQPMPINVSANDTVTTDTTTPAVKPEDAKELNSAATKVVKSSDKKVPPAAKAAVKKATQEIAKGNPNLKLRNDVILAAKYIGKFTSNQWAKFAESLEAALEESRKEYSGSKK
jgi:hypothetical protein